MKRTIRIGLLFFLSVFLGLPLAAQVKIAYVNSDRIMQEFEEAKEAQQKLDAEAQKLQEQYGTMTTQLDSMQQDYQRQQFVMSEERRKQKQSEIQQLQQRIQQFQMQNVGPQGQIYAKQEQILGPVLKKINAAIKKVAVNNGYDFVLDSVNGNLLYAEEKYNITADVLYELRRGSSSGSTTK